MEEQLTSDFTTTPGSLCSFLLPPWVLEFVTPAVKSSPITLLGLLDLRI